MRSQAFVQSLPCKCALPDLIILNVSKNRIAQVFIFSVGIEPIQVSLKLQHLHAPLLGRPITGRQVLPSALQRGRVLGVRPHLPVSCRPWNEPEERLFVHPVAPILSAQTEQLSGQSEVR